MSQQTQHALFKAAVNWHRIGLFGDSSLKLFSITPANGEAEIFEFAEDWKGHRVRPTTSGMLETETGAWQFQIIAPEDWEITQADIRKAVALTVGTRRWKVTRIEEPVGVSLVWKLRAEVQKQ